MDKQTWKFESSSSDKMYTVIKHEDGHLSCDCRGWTFKRGDRPRECKHTREVESEVTREIKTTNGFVQIGTDVVRFDRHEDLAPSKIQVELHSLRVAGDVDYVAPMLAGPMPVGKTVDSFSADEWVMEEKFDGHRVTVIIKDGTVDAWSRPRANGKANRRTLPGHISSSLANLPNGTYDGELIVTGGRSYDVVNGANAGREQYVVFDVVRLLDQSTIEHDYDTRRSLLVQIFTAIKPNGVIMAESRAPSMAWLKEIWGRDGEGAILKRRAARYQPGKRSADFIKIKKLRTATLTVIGYTAGKLGPYSTVELKDDDGNEVSVKTLNNEELRRLAATPSAFIGRKLRIEYQERTPDGGYRHPRWDRFDNE